MKGLAAAPRINWRTLRILYPSDLRREDQELLDRYTDDPIVSSDITWEGNGTYVLSRKHHSELFDAFVGVSPQVHAILI